jgi:hypothetical protein
MHFELICTWDHDGLGTNMQFGPWRTWDKNARGTKLHLGTICSWDQITLETNMQLWPICIWDQNALICTHGFAQKSVPLCRNRYHSEWPSAEPLKYKAVTENLYNNQNVIGNSKYFSIEIKFQIYASKN